MDFQLTFAESALVDLEEILTYPWTNFPDTAERFGAALLDHVELLKRFPLMGTPVLNRPGVRPRIRRAIQRSPDLFERALAAGEELQKRPSRAQQHEQYLLLRLLWKSLAFLCETRGRLGFFA